MALIEYQSPQRVSASIAQRRTGYGYKYGELYGGWKYYTIPRSTSWINTQQPVAYTPIKGGAGLVTTAGAPTTSYSTTHTGVAAMATNQFWNTEAPVLLVRMGSALTSYTGAGREDL